MEGSSDRMQLLPLIAETNNASCMRSGNDDASSIVAFASKVTLPSSARRSPAVQTIEVQTLSSLRFFVRHVWPCALNKWAKDPTRTMNMMPFLGALRMDA